jgi:hypothetical protein
MKINLISIFSVIIVLISGHSVTAQASSTILSARNSNAQAAYYEKIVENQLILSGRNYYNYYPATAGHQYVFEKNYQKTSMIYDGVLYEDISLNYDIYNHELVLSSVRNNQVSYLILDKKRVQELILEERRFIYDDLDGLSAVAG